MVKCRLITQHTMKTRVGVGGTISSNILDLGTRPM
jgi:hypothetical protein